MNDKKKFLLIHGSWHDSSCWDRVIPLLKSQGHEVKAIDLPGRTTGFLSAWKISIQDHEQAIVTTARKMNGKVIAVGHSMGGQMISVAAEKAPECFERLVYLSAFLPRNGDSVMSLAKEDDKSQVPSVLSISMLRGKSTLKSNAAEVFYNDCSPEDIAMAKTHLVSEPARPNFTKIKLTAERHGSIPRAYIHCKKDLGLTPSHQKRMLERQPCDRTATLDTSHSPFYSQPDELTRVLLEVSQ